jgi:hypothetical protein
VTEAEWLACADPTPMLEHTRWTASDRKLRLFTVACARLVWDRLPPGELREAVELAERVADGHPWEPELAAMCRRLYFRGVQYSRDTGRNWYTDTPADELGLHATALKTTTSPISLHYTLARSLWHRWTLPLTGRHQPALLRCILGNPFHPVAADTRWLTPPLLAFARELYDARSFDRLPALADALAGAGCEDREMLSHCRAAGPHARGCWVVDLVLGQE